MRRVFYPTQSSPYDEFSSNKDIVGLSNPFSPCEELIDFIRKEEEFSFNDWKAYRQSIIRYQNGVPEEQKPELVMTLARQLVKVLKSDLRIYENMKIRTECIDINFYNTIDPSITFTKSVIGFYNEGKILDGTIFNPFKESDFNEYPVASGTYWDTEFYSEYESVEKYLVQPLLKDPALSYQEQQPILADWQINTPPYPFKIIDEFGSILDVTTDGINTYAFGTPVFVDIRSPIYSSFRLCGEGECDILADWQINTPPYPFKIIDEFGSILDVTTDGINTYAFGTPVFVDIRSPIYSSFRLCGEGECE